MPGTVLDVGSSPRGRGKQLERSRDRARAGLIPARAGKTHRPDSTGTGWSAHPRAGGENAASSWGGRQFPGSSPRGRGKRSAGPPGRHTLRLIPARAGKTSRSWRLRALATAHPRAGGENRLSTSSHSSSRGSSPRGRGKHGFGPFGLSPVRLIPARAGKTSSSDRATFVTGAHPRAGGENGQDGHDEGAPAGSSPRGRGKLIVSQGMTRP